VTPMLNGTWHVDRAGAAAESIDAARVAARLA
jgi:hypothetical protein